LCFSTNSPISSQPNFLQEPFNDDEVYTAVGAAVDRAGGNGGGDDHNPHPIVIEMMMNAPQFDPGQQPVQQNHPQQNAPMGPEQPLQQDLEPNPHQILEGNQSQDSQGSPITNLDDLINPIIGTAAPELVIKSSKEKEPPKKRMRINLIQQGMQKAKEEAKKKAIQEAILYAGDSGLTEEETADLLQRVEKEFN